MKPPIKLRTGTFSGALVTLHGPQKGVIVAQARKEGKTVNVWLSDLLHKATEPARDEIELKRENEA
jgi:hypothetical protein